MKLPAQILSEIIGQEVGNVEIRFYNPSTSWGEAYTHDRFELRLEFTVLGEPLQVFDYGSVRLVSSDGYKYHAIMFYGKETQQIMKALWSCFDPEGDTQCKQ